MDATVATTVVLEDSTQEEAHAAAAISEPQGAAAVAYFKSVDLARALAPDAFQPVQKVQNMYVAPLQEPMVVQTPVLTLAAALEADDDEEESTRAAYPTHAQLVLPRPFAAFARDAEGLVLAAALANKVEWFRRSLDDEVLQARFKAFCRTTREGATHLRVRLAPDFALFDVDGTILDRAPAHAPLRCVLQLSRVCFGRTEFGASWTLLQAQLAPAPAAPKCLIDASADRQPEPESKPDFDLHEFL
jgi:hypothetical protein